MVVENGGDAGASHGVSGCGVGGLQDIGSCDRRITRHPDQAAAGRVAYGAEPRDATRPAPHPAIGRQAFFTVVTILRTFAVHVVGAAYGFWALGHPVKFLVLNRPHSPP